MAAGAERAVRLEHDPVLLARFEERPAVGVRVEVDLVHDRRDRRLPQERAEILHIEVGHPDRARIAELARSLHARPRPRRASLGPVDDVQVDVLEAEPVEAPFRLRRRVAAATWKKLRRYEDL